jgi:hypothetical protein
MARILIYESILVFNILGQPRDIITTNDLHSGYDVFDGVMMDGGKEAKIDAGCR